MSERPDYNSPFLEAGVQAYLEWYKLMWVNYSDRPLKTAFVPNVADLRKTKDITKDVVPPILNAAIARIELDAAKGAASRRFTPFISGIDRTKGKARVRTMVPVRVGVVTNFRSDDGRDISSFIQMMLNTYPGTTFYFEDDIGFRVACRVFVDDGYDFPQSDISNAGDLFLLEPVVSFTTYIGTEAEQGLIRSIRVQYTSSSGGQETTLYEDRLDGKESDLEKTTLKYTDPFDKTSSQWRS